MDTNTLIILLGVATLFVTTIGIGIAVILYLSKKIDDLNDRLTNIEGRLSKIENKLDISDERINSTNVKVDYTIPRVERIENIVFTNGVHKKEEQPAELELQ